MKLSAIYQALAIACISTTGLATLLLEDVPSNLTIGSSIRLKWTADHDYVSKSVTNGKTNDANNWTYSL
jgi:hypothetical protein